MCHSASTAFCAAALHDWAVAVKESVTTGHLLLPASRLTGLLSVLRQHLRRWLPDLVGLLHDFWGAGPAVLPVLLELVAELASAALHAFKT